MEEVGVSIKKDDILHEMTIDAYYIDGKKTAYIYLVDTWEGMPDNIEPDIHNAYSWKTIEELPYPMIPHIRQWIEWLLAWEKYREYHAL